LIVLILLISFIVVIGMRRKGIIVTVGVKGISADMRASVLLAQCNRLLLAKFCFANRLIMLSAGGYI
jgi:hypothetical protein